MEFLLAFLAGAAVTYGWQRWTARSVSTGAPATSPPEEMTPPPVVEPTHAPARSPIEQLQSLTSALDAAGEASAHPSDMASNAAFTEAVALMASDRIPLKAVVDYAMGANWAFAAAAYAALVARGDRAERREALLRHIRHLGPWPLHYALLYARSLDPRPPLGEALLRGREWWAQHAVVPTVFAAHLEECRKRGESADFGSSLQGINAEEIAAAENLLDKIDHPFAAQLLEQLQAWKRTSLDRPYLESFGRFPERDLEEELLIEHGSISEQLNIGAACLTQPAPRSVIVVAEPRNGKTAFLRLLAARMATKGWTLFEAGAASLMSGQQYFGQLEERLRRMITELSAEKRVLWYVPDLLQLATSGTHNGQSASILDQMFPAIASGRVALLSETTPAGLTKLFQRKAALRGAVEIVRLRSLSEVEIVEVSRRFAERMREVLSIDIDAESLDAANHLARHYLGTTQMPGALLDLMKLGAQQAAASDATVVTRGHLLQVLSQLTGMPASVLDDRQRVDLSHIRAFFAARVIGQPDAVAAIVDRIAMLKAGLTDPSRPTAVFLFAGPTGTGKTELAKTLAEYLFGSSERLIRLDMSEFQARESAYRILGGAGDAGDSDALTQRIRKQPFSVVLLDEFEKAHPSIWDLFLQVFDDGRLTDGNGQTADFRHSIVILTSNLGATSHESAMVGFSPQSSAFSPAQIERAVAQSFRPEFVNRLDKVTVFRPLTRELMRDILKKELARVLERRGLRHREWAVEWESSALDFLLEHGFSPAMGARPLKRSIDQHLLAPLAATLVEHRFPEGDQFLFVRSDGRAIQVEFVDPDAPEPAVAGASVPTEPSGSLTLAHVILQSTGSASERALLQAELAKAEEALASPAWLELRSGLAASMQTPDFWDRASRHGVLARYALMDRVEAATETARGLAARMDRRGGPSGGYSRDLLQRLAAQLWVIRDGMDDALTDSPIEVALHVEPSLDAIGDRMEARAWSDQLLTMYRAWAQRRRMLIDQSSGPDVLVISGFGASRLLLGEAGLHVLEQGNDNTHRIVARVSVVPTPLGATTNIAALRKDLQSSSSAHVIRRYRTEPPLVRDARWGWRTGRTDLVFRGDFDLLGRYLLQ